MAFYGALYERPMRNVDEWAVRIAVAVEKDGDRRSGPNGPPLLLWSRELLSGNPLEEPLWQDVHPSELVLMTGRRSLGLRDRVTDLDPFPG